MASAIISMPLPKRTPPGPWAGVRDLMAQRRTLAKRREYQYDHRQQILRLLDSQHRAEQLEAMDELLL